MMELYLSFALLLVFALCILLAPLWISDVSKRSRIYFVAIVTPCFFAGGFGIYALVGSPDIIPLLAQRDSKLAQLKDVITQQSTEVKINPNNIVAWVELGESFMETSQYDAAANAFKQAVLLSQGDPRLIMAYARALIFAGNDHIGDDAKKSLQMVLRLDPKNEEARYYMAVCELQEGNPKAMEDMKALYHSLPDDSPIKAMIDKQIGRN